MRTGKRWLSPLMVCGLMAQVSPQPAPDAATYRIAGVVVHGVSGQPLGRVRVSIAPALARERETVLFTAADGRFAFGGVTAGKWQLKARREGFGTFVYGQRPTWNSPGVAIVTGPEMSTEDLVFRLHPPGVVTGTVTDEFGEPVGNALVQLFASFIEGGRRRVAAIRSTWTDSAGGYRIWQLVGGTYYAAVSATPWFASQLQTGGDNMAGMGFEPQFFPGASSAEAAAPFRVEPGEERTVDFRLRFRKGVSVRVEALRERTESMLFAPGPRGSQMLVQRIGADSGDRFTGVQPGRYRLVLVGKGAGMTPRSQQIDIGTADMQIIPSLPAPVPVTLAVQGAGVKPEVLRKLLVSLRSEEQLSGEVRRIVPGEKIVLRDLQAGRYVLWLLGERDEVYLDTVTAQGAGVEMPFIELVEGQPAHLELVVKGDGGRVDGEVRVDGKRAAGRQVALAPREESADLSAYRGFATDLDGSFEFTGIKPGEYLLFTSDEPEFPYMDRDAVRAYYERATPVHVEPGSSQTIRIDVEGSPATQPAR